MTTEIIHEDDDYTTTQCQVVRETDKSIAITGTKGKLVWIPKSQIEIEQTFDNWELTIPNWLILKENIV